MFGFEIYTGRRYWEIDLLRGVGITMMVISNFVTDLQLFLNYSSHRTFWLGFAITTASIFVFASGLSMWISYSRTLGKKPNPYWKYLRRFFKLFGLGLLITATTYFLGMTIHFGILHFLGLATLLGVLFYRFGRLNALWAVFFILGHLVLRNFHDGLWLLPVGVLPENYFAELGREVLRLELAFNRAAGLPEVEPLPRFFYDEPLPPTNRRARLDPQVVAQFWRRFLEGPGS